MSPMAHTKATQAMHDARRVSATSRRLNRLKRKQATYDQFVAAFRTHQGNITAVADAMRCSWEAAKLVYTKGWPELRLPPVKEFLEEEIVAARAALARQRKAELEKVKQEQAQAREQAIHARKQEGAMVAATRNSVLQSSVAVYKLASACKELSEVIAERVAFEKHKITTFLDYERAHAAGQQVKPPKFARPAMSLPQLVDLLNKSATYAQRISQSARGAMEMERLHLGQPTDTLAIVDKRTDITREELDARKEAALQAISSAQVAGGLKVLDGGKSHPEIGQRVIIK